MEYREFDRLTKSLASVRVSRRRTLKRGSVGVLAGALASLASYPGDRDERAAAAPLAQATPAATPGVDDPNAISIDGAWFCNQTFALCTTAPCELSESDPTIANCHCIVVDGYAIGFKKCEERAQSGKSVTSNFSTLNVNSEFAVLTCPEEVGWANCLDVPCEIDEFNPAVATCQCQIVAQGPSLTFGGGCDTETCTSTIWSAAPEGLLGLAQYETGMQMVNQEVVLPEACPAPDATPVATAAG